MIYEFPDTSEPIRQGDIFVGLPLIEISLRQIAVLEINEKVVQTSWEDVRARGETVSAILPVRPATAIVASQDCDNVHGRDVTLCEIRDFREVERKSKDTPQTPSKWVSLITQQARINQKWFYLPPDERLGFKDKMGVDFMVTLRVPRVDLQDLRTLRRGRLNHVADEHFRERIAEFFRRYPYDEWYPLTPEEYAAYRERYPETQPFSWQQSGQ
jgi:hypothetical protein